VEAAEDAVDLALGVAHADVELEREAVEDDQLLGVLGRDLDQPAGPEVGPQHPGLVLRRIAGGVGCRALGGGGDGGQPEGLAQQHVLAVGASHDQLAGDQPGQRLGHLARGQARGQAHVVHGGRAEDQGRHHAAAPVVRQQAGNGRRVGHRRRVGIGDHGPKARSGTKVRRIRWGGR
jgi:hypothetical protein